MADIALTPQQLTIICALSSGVTTLAAAEQAGVHRNTITNWRRNQMPFQRALAEAQYDRAIFFREKIEAEVDLAIQTLHHLLTDPKTPPAVRLKAALAILTTASTPPAPKKQIELDICKVNVSPDQPPAPKPAQPEPEAPLQPIVHKPAQPDPEPQPTPTPDPQIVHNPAQSSPDAAAAHPRPYVPKTIARNADCPCRSGRTYKRCCMTKHSQPLATAA